MGSSYGYDLLVLVRLGTLHICAPNNRLTVAFGACWSRMHSTKAWAFQDIASHHDRTPRNMCIADSDTCSSHDLFGTYRRKCIGEPNVRWPGTLYRDGSYTRSSCDGVLTCCIPCNSLGNPCILSHVRHCHSNRRPCFDVNFPFTPLCSNVLCKLFERNFWARAQPLLVLPS
jgi:hypothetical protein